MPYKAPDPFEKAIERTLEPGTFIGYRRASDFVENLERLRAKISALVKEREAARAVTLLQTFIAACCEKTDEIDDSGGGLGQLVEELFCDWIRARQATKADPAETARTLLSWMDGRTYGHDLGERAVKVLDRAGLAAFEHAVRERAGAAEVGSYARRRGVGVLKAIHRRRRDVAAYVALCESEGELAPADCETLAEICLARHRPEDALAWVERGLAEEKERRWSSRSAWRLPDLKREILVKLGRSREALIAAWENYQRSPSIYAYDDLMKLVPARERAKWHAEALGVIEGADLSSRIELLVKTKERKLLAETIEAAPRADLVALGHYAIEPAATTLRRSHPLLAAKILVAMALRTLEAKKSRYYGAALGNLEAAQTILRKEGRADEWTALAAEIREAHRRRTGFISRFERLVAGTPPREPSFLDRARQRWIRDAGRRSEAS